MGILATLPRAETAERRHLIGASAAPVILGLSPWQTPMGLWLRMTGEAGEGHGGEEPLALQRGRHLEPAILNWTAEATGADEIERGITLAEPGIAGPEPWMAFHPDGALRYGDEWRLAEIKTSRAASEWGEDGTDQIPPQYLAQVQFQLACMASATDTAQVGAWLTMTDRLARFVVKRDEAFCRWMIDTCGEWWLKHIAGGVAPDLDGSAACKAHLFAQFPRVRSALRQASEEEAALIGSFAQTKAMIASAEAAEAELSNRVRAACGDGEGLIAPGIGKVTLREVAGAETVDSKKLRAEFPEVWEACKRKGADRRDLRFWAEKV